MDVTTAEMIATSNPEFANMVRLDTLMLVKGRVFETCRALMQEWLKDEAEFCPYGGILILEKEYGEHRFWLYRNPENHQLVILKEVQNKRNKIPPLSHYTIPSQEAQNDIPKYMVSVVP